MGQCDPPNAAIKALTFSMLLSVLPARAQDRVAFNMGSDEGINVCSSGVGLKEGSLGFVVMPCGGVAMFGTDMGKHDGKGNEGISEGGVIAGAGLTGGPWQAIIHGGGEGGQCLHFSVVGQLFVGVGRIGDCCGFGGGDKFCIIIEGLEFFYGEKKAKTTKTAMRG